MRLSRGFCKIKRCASSPNMQWRNNIIPCTHQEAPESSDKGFFSTSPENFHSILCTYFKTDRCLPATKVSSLMKNCSAAEQSLLVQQTGRLCVMCSSTEGHQKDSVRAGAGRLLRPPACASASAHSGLLVYYWGEQPVTDLGTRLHGQPYSCI